MERQIYHLSDGTRSSLSAFAEASCAQDCSKSQDKRSPQTTLASKELTSHLEGKVYFDHEQEWTKLQHRPAEPHGQGTGTLTPRAPP